MKTGKIVVYLLRGALLLLLIGALRFPATAAERHLLYVAVPGIRNDIQWGGIGILVFDINQGHRFLKRIPTLTPEPGQEPEAIRGICASARTGKLYLSTPISPDRSRSA